MTIVIAPDSFKECMTANEACDIIKQAVNSVLPQARCIASPLADGGEGSMRILVEATRGKTFSQKVKDPLGNDVEAAYGILGDGKTAVVEMAAASGLQLVSINKRNPLITTSYGTGQLIKAALNHSIEKLIITIGGSATNDGGVGMLQALGISFLNKENKEIGFGGGRLGEIDHVDISHFLLSTYPGVKFEVACDVNNPLTGPNGASAVYGTQKGATTDMISLLDANLHHYAKIIKRITGNDIEFEPGAGAAGGMGAALMAFFNAELISGVQLVMKYTALEEKIASADLIITGEGSIDKQTLHGKAIHGLTALAKKYNKPVVAFVGKVADRNILETVESMEIIEITPPGTSIAEALKNGKENLAKAVRVWAERE